MANVKDFLKTYWPSILTVVVTFITLLTAFSILNVNFNQPKNTQIEKVVTVEAFSSKPNIDALHQVYKGDLPALDNLCKGFSVDTANTASFCVCLDGKTPVGGSVRGPTYLTKDGEKIDYKYYTWKGTCPRGNCPN